MPSLPTQGGNRGTWGTDINAFLTVSMEPAAGTLKSAAITGGLGYTPVNQAGDTMSGPLLVGGGIPAFGTNGYMADNNTAVGSPGNRGISQALGVRLGSGLVSDKSLGYYSVVVDSASAKRATITGATNASPIVITATAHGMNNGDVVMVSGVLGNTAANGKFTIANKAANTFELAGSTGNGAYVSGGVATTAGSLFGAQFTVGPTVPRLFGVGGGPGAYGDDVIGLAVYNSGTTKATCGVNVGLNAAISGSDFKQGVGIDADCDQGVQFSTGSTFGTGIYMSGTYTSYGIDLAVGTVSSLKAIRIPNATFITALNAAASTDISIIGLNASDQVSMPTLTRMDAGMVVAGGQNIIFSTTTGTKIGTATNQPLAFHNSTPVVQHATTGETVGFTAGGGTTVTDASTFTGNVGATAYRISDIVKALKNKGLMAA
jgi:hypothetical protein